MGTGTYVPVFDVVIGKPEGQIYGMALMALQGLFDCYYSRLSYALASCDRIGR